MNKKILFKKKNKKTTNIIIILAFFLFLYLIFYYIKITGNEYFTIPSNNESFFYIPKDRGGQEIPNQDKKGLHLSYLGNDLHNIIIDNEIKFSIQIFTNTDYQLVNDMRIELLKKKDSIFFPEDFLIAIFDSTLGKEFYLLYKNFLTRKKAEEYCEKYVYFLDKCLIVNVQNLD